MPATRAVIEMPFAPLQYSLPAIAALLVLHGAAAAARDRIHIVGSSTVYPLATVVAEWFGKTTRFKTPVVESTGTGGGLKLFCGGIGVRRPDIANASRRITASEVALCAGNGVTHITEVEIGFDGIVIANAKTAPILHLTKRQIFLALAKNVPGPDGKPIANPHRRWSDIDPALPGIRIKVLGPPPTSGTRDAFVELAMAVGCETFPALARLKQADRRKFKAICHGIREDGFYVEAGENDNLIVRKLVADPDAFGIFGFGFLEQNADKVQGAVIDGVTPSFANIASGRYDIARALYFYVKGAHVRAIPGIREYIRAFTSEAAWGPNGYLAERGLIPLPDGARRKMRAAALRLAPLRP